MYNIEKLAQYIPRILDYFELKYKTYPNRYAMSCPIHGGDNQNGCSILKDNGKWACWTQHCENNYGKNFIGFIQGYLDVVHNQKTSYAEAVRWTEKLLDTDLFLQIDEDSLSKRNFNNLANTLQLENIKHTGVTRDIIRKKLQIPSSYFINRGFSKSILDKYDVGFCTNKEKFMADRIVVPIYNDEYTEAIGFMGRTTEPLCDICKTYHSPRDKCPQTSFETYKANKWINSKGFNSNNYLYNYWFAKKYIHEQHKVILVEGCADVFRLEEADIHIGLGLFGLDISNLQMLKLEKSGATTVIVAMDNDSPGIEARFNLIEKLKRYYDVQVLELSKKDIGELSINEVKQLFKELI